jgi:sialidase-1
VYSDDHGKTWKFGKEEPPKWKGTNSGERSVLEMPDGSIYMNCRNSHFRADYRLIARSRDGGVTWSKPVEQRDLPQYHRNGHGAHSGLARLSDEKRHDRNRLLFSTPGPPGRKNLAIYISYDETKSWKRLKVIKEGPAGYSNLIVLPDRSIACIYDAEMPGKGWQVRFTRFTLEWLTDSRDTVAARGTAGSDVE